MKHVRQQIREWVYLQLAELADGRVFDTRTYPKQTLPAIGFYQSSDEAEVENEQIGGEPRRYWRTADLWIEVTCEANEDVQNEVDNNCADVEVALGTDLTFGGLCVDSRYISTQIAYSVEGQKPIATARMLYHVEYRTDSTDPSEAL